MTKDIDPPAEANVLLELLTSYLQGSMSVDEFLVAMHQLSPPRKGDPDIGFHMDLAGEDERRRMQELIDAFTDPPPGAV
ncbi:MAG: hypothetical protein H0U13_16905 [Gemmatimonadaceae bacterium]|nr:hypothetical protein [Gemmatimonadaceae bacterium]